VLNDDLLFVQPAVAAAHTARDHGDRTEGGVPPSDAGLDRHHLDDGVGIAVAAQDQDANEFVAPAARRRAEPLEAVDVTGNQRLPLLGHDPAAGFSDRHVRRRDARIPRRKQAEQRFLHLGQQAALAVFAPPRWARVNMTSVLRRGPCRSQVTGNRPLCDTAVSTGQDPFGPYYRYEFLRPLFPDYPRPAIWPDGYYVPTSTGDDPISETVATQKHATSYSTRIGGFRLPGCGGR
jgi:hypothetical protein